MDGEKLFDLFVAHSTTVGEIAEMALSRLILHIDELRYEAQYKDSLPYSSAEIGIAIFDWARRDRGITVERSNN